ncbi:YdcF family protein [Kamptonema formosum]|uniref:YdcF family protein n=1 Tax=Kamptonema formosum TaxID=331992 RepID=UPI00036F5FF9|nr:YdcF family protein [Oscillatoria sp. PCC 10802]
MAVRQKKGFLPRLNLTKFWMLLLSTALIALTGCIPVRLAMTLHQVPVPQAILVLGGDVTRMMFAAKFWRSHPNLEIWVSDEPQNINYLKRLFQKAGIPERQIHYDICATDTVTNFTCTVQNFAQREIRHLYLITSDYHMARARAIATFVLGSRGIAVTPLSVPSQGQPPDSLLRIARDCVRSVLWIATGRTGARFNPRLNSGNSGNLN